jgi:hypothetical protein
MITDHQVDVLIVVAQLVVMLRDIFLLEVSVGEHFLLKLLSVSLAVLH